MLVISRARYMAICRASAMFFVRARPTRSSKVRWKYFATWVMISVGLISTSVEKKSCRVCSASARVTGWLFSDATAETRVSAPSSSRMFSVNRSAMRSSTSFGICIWFIEAIMRRIAMRVSRSGGLTSTVRPDSNREIRRASKPLRFFGATSDAITMRLFA